MNIYRNGQYGPQNIRREQPQNPFIKAHERGLGDPKRTVPMRVLVVDDEPNIRSVVPEGLKAFGERDGITFEIGVAANGEEALKIFREAREKGEPFGLVITDIRMPGMSGVDLMEEINRIAPHTRIIFMSGYIDGRVAERVQAAIERGDASGLLEKPFSLKELWGMVQNE
ncbi:MAG: response regulator [Candidatus Micrarchaeia archaeon]